MSKRKHKGKHGGKRDRQDRAEARLDIPPQIAGIAAAALHQANTPAFRQLIAGALGAAAQAFDQRRSPPPSSAAPVPPAPPQPVFTTIGQMPPHEAAEAIERVADQAGRAIETAAASAARAIEATAQALERWTERQLGPAPRGDAAGEPPHP